MTSPSAEATTAETFDHAPPTDSDSAATSQAVITAQIQEIEASYRASGVVELQPRLDYPPYRSTILRHPTKDLRHADPETIELWAPCFGHRDVHAIEADLTIQHGGEPIGERMIVTGRVLDGEAGQSGASWWRSGRPTPAAGTCISVTSIRHRLTRTSPGWAGA